MRFLKCHGIKSVDTVSEKLVITIETEPFSPPQHLGIQIISYSLFVDVIGLSLAYQ